MHIPPRITVRKTMMYKSDLREEINRLHAEVCSALADPIRILILYSLAEQRSNVGDLARNLDFPQPTISRHLKILRERSMVTHERQGQSVLYGLKDMRVIQALDLLRGILADNLKTQSSLAEQANEMLEPTQSSEDPK